MSKRIAILHSSRCFEIHLEVQIKRFANVVKLSAVNKRKKNAIQIPHKRLILIVIFSRFFQTFTLLFVKQIYPQFFKFLS